MRSPRVVRLCSRPFIPSFVVLVALIVLIPPAACGGDETIHLADTAVTDTASEEVHVDTDTDTTPEEVTLPEIIAIGDFGHPCEDNADCSSGYCVPGPDGYVCTRLCDLSCDPGWNCVGVTAFSPDIVFVCVPQPDRLCEACESDDDCEGGACRELAEGKACTRPCTDGERCPPGFACASDVSTSDGPLQPQCVPVSDQCSCTWRNPGEVRPCQSTNTFGACQGTQACLGADGWGDCSAPAPAAETCNGRDDDCNGDIDDAPAVPAAPCVNPNDHGSCAGAWVCMGSAGWACDAPAPEAELCDHRDNDCDGQSDEDFRDPATGLYATDAHCGGCGSSCGDAIPHGVGGCAIADGHARCEVQTCDAGYYPADRFVCRPVEDMSCMPCATDASCLVPGASCLPIHDSGVGSGGALACAIDCGEDNLFGLAPGTCPPRYQCDDVGEGRMRCLPTSGACDCDAANAGQTRACVDQSAFGLCTGIQTCDGASGWSACTALHPAAETCNGVDDDCNGVRDEGVSTPTDPCRVENALGTCTGDWQCRGAAGWVCPARPAEAELCDFADNDCSGVVDDAFRDPQTGLYVADTDCGTCGNDCTGALPHATGRCSVESGAPRCVVAACDPGFYQVAATSCLALQDLRCTPCAEDANCVVPGNACVALEDGNFCGRDCGVGNLYGLPPGECDPGYVCSELGDGRAECVPATDSCSCLEAGDEGLSKACVQTNAFGTCLGTAVCDAAEGWSACSARVPAAELCNGLDDDCDGMVDEGVGVPAPTCTITNEAGACTGAWRCEGEAGWQCDAVTPAAETCDRQDDDCDGSIDEGFVDAATGKYLAFENCGVCGNSCAGAIPFAAETTCGYENGLAVCLAVRCDPGYEHPFGTERACAPIGGATDCSPCTEDIQCASMPGGLCMLIDRGAYCTRGCAASGDCPDGYECAADRCLPLTASCSCLASDAGEMRVCFEANALGTCIGTETCDPTPGTGWSACTAATPFAEICNDADDDCDGLADEDVAHLPPECAQSNAAGTCPGEWRCEGASGWRCTARTPGSEACDYVDNDCDGGVDEDFRDEAGRYIDDAQCGACGIACAESIPHATAFCSAATGHARCEVLTCAPGYFQAGPLTCFPAVDTLCNPCEADANCPTPGDRCLVVDGAGRCARDCGEGNVRGTPAGVCPPDYTCTPQLDGGAQCVPTSGSCTCLPDDDGASRSCAVQNALGACFGSETCIAEGAGPRGWSGCTARTPAVEICNDSDDDCNVLVDDVAGRGAACTVTNAYGACVGLRECVPDTTPALACTAQIPSGELCNGRDDDCDGATDEPFPDLFAPCSTGLGICHAYGTRRCAENGSATVCDAVEAPAAPEACNGVDDDCDGATDEGAAWADQGDPCVVGLGACAAIGVWRCAADPAAPVECSAIAGAATVESCNGRDDDCDGTIDEVGAGPTDLVRPLCEAQNGVCQGAKKTCAGVQGWLACNGQAYGAGYETPEATCDNLDNDCDGAVDETLPIALCENQVGVCAGSQKTCLGALGFGACNAAERGPSYESTETRCDYLDNDCDGAVDEAFRNGDGLYVANDHCGTCSVSCVGAIPNATAACVVTNGQPRCEVTACAPGYFASGTTACLPATDNTCAPCATNANCPTPGDLCVPLDGASFCGRDCSAGNAHGSSAGECPAGFVCDDIRGGKQCVPVSRSCTCLAANQGETRTCLAANAFGTCYGAETCNAAAGWSACTARVPATETCNALDDDCNAAVDDVSGRGNTCAISNASGTCHGVRDCVAGQSALVCVGQTPAPEICNYVDDDCDTAVDEGFADLHESCSNGVGACRRFGMRVCADDGSATACNAVAADATPERCNNIDDDCDGLTDEDPAWADKGALCSVGLGVCEAFGNRVCTPDGLTTACNATAGTAQSEACDLLDNDCDGVTDEDYKNAQDDYALDATCGNCFTDCTEIYAKPHAFGTCDTSGAAPGCAMQCCRIGTPGAGCSGPARDYFDLNAVPDDGCEFMLDPAAIYVSASDPTADDDDDCGLGPATTGGTRHPCETIRGGLARAVATGRTAVLVADGLYVETVTLVGGIDLLGAYRADTWERHLASTNTTLEGPTVMTGHVKTVIADGLTTPTVFEGFVVRGGLTFGVGANTYAFYLRNTSNALAIRNNLVFGGTGGPGAVGGSGTGGGDGGPGQRGERAILTDEVSRSACQALGSVPGNVPLCLDPSGNAGTSTCGAGGTNTCGGAAGGAGAGAVCPNDNAQEPSGAAGVGVAGGGAGGTAGVGGYDRHTSGTSCSLFSTGGESAEGGAAGNGANGASEAGGIGGAATSSVIGGEWSGESGGDGGSGHAGGGGGGGGAGGGADVASDCGNTNDSLGGSGGGGGAGGCGGAAGHGGGAGGASILFFITSTAQTPPAASSLVTLVGNTLTRGTGGAGGRGGAGGKGGLGGNGGAGGAVAGEFDYAMASGGRGGQGGDGGHGGGGGGGAGGASFGIYVDRVTGTPTYLGANVFVPSGAGGDGGVGGLSPGSNGQDGAEGNALDTND